MTGLNDVDIKVKNFNNMLNKRILMINFAGF